jgi:hypothetical protein
MRDARRVDGEGARRHLVGERLSRRAPVLASWMRPGMNASFENPAATNGHLTSMPRFSSSFSLWRMLPIISSPDQTTIQPAFNGHQPLLSSHCFDFGEICS